MTDSRALGRARPAGVLLQDRPDAGAEKGFNINAWGGYAANRDRIADAIADSAVHNHDCSRRTRT